MGVLPEIEIIAGFCLSDREELTLEIGGKRSMILGGFGI